MANFEEAHKEVMGNEGGYANNPDDAGGETYKGIARKFHPGCAVWKYIDNIKSGIGIIPAYGSPGFYPWVKRINTYAAANPAIQKAVLDFYATNFWRSNMLDEVDNQAVATWIYDHAVNAGGRGIKWVQEAAGVTADGDIGPKTIAAINAHDPALLLQEAEDIAAYYRIDKAVADSTQIQFLPSWLRRDGVSESEIQKVMQAAKNGLTYAEAKQLKEMIGATA